VRSDLIETFKIMNGEYDLNSDLFFPLEEGGRRGHDQKLFKRRFRIDIRKYVLCNRVIDNWNSLSAGCVNCNTINTLHFWTSTLALPWIFVLGQRFDHYECGRLSWLGQLYGAL